MYIIELNIHLSLNTLTVEGVLVIIIANITFGTWQVLKKCLPNERVNKCQLTTQWAYLASVICKIKNHYIFVNPDTFYGKIKTRVIIYLVFIQCQALC